MAAIELENPPDVDTMSKHWLANSKVRISALCSTAAYVRLDIHEKELLIMPPTLHYLCITVQPLLELEHDEGRSRTLGGLCCAFYIDHVERSVVPSNFK